MGARVLIDAGIDAGAVWHCGDPMREQRALLEGSARVDLSHFPTLRIAGPDRLTWLHALTSQSFVDLLPRVWTTALFLDPNGRVRFVITGVDDGEAFTAFTQPGMIDDLLAHLRRMVFMSRVEITQPDVVVQGGGDGEVAFVEHDHEVMTMAGLWAWEALRIARGEPRIGVDTDERCIPNEIGLYATALGKGCYPGQETVARVQTLGRPPRRLVRLQLDGSLDRLPAVGAEVVLGERRVGFVGSSARHYEQGPIALALITRATPIDAEFSVDGIAATQEVLVDPNIGEHIRPLR